MFAQTPDSFDILPPLILFVVFSSFPCIKTATSSVSIAVAPASDLEHCIVPNLYQELEELYCQLRQQLFTCALAITKSPARAEDAVHEAICRVLKNEMRPRELRSYLFRSVRNAALDQVRSKSFQAEMLPEVVLDSSPQPAIAAEEAEFQRNVAESMRQLSADQRETIIEHLFGELTFQEIATMRDVPLGTVVSWYRRGIETLRQKMEVVYGRI